MNKKTAVIAFVTLGVIATCSFATLTAQQQRAAAQSADARLKDLEDRQAIHVLLMNYGRTLDSRDFAGFEHLFAREAEYGGRGGMAKGPAAIRARLEAALKVNAAPTPGRDWHLFFNETIEVHGDEATALSMGAFFVRGDGNKLESNAIAAYTDHIVREDGMWKFKSRELGAVLGGGAAPPSAEPAR
jgi:SnoaL-like protein